MNTSSTSPPRPPRPRPPARVSTAVPSGLPARLAAVEALDQILRAGRVLDEAMASAAGLEPRDRALARNIVATTLRRLGTLRALLAGVLERGAPRGAPRVETVLLVGACQILFLDVPDHAAVGLAVDIARRDRETAGFAGLINAVLRRITREGGERLAEIAPRAPDLPTWLRQRWAATYGEDVSLAIRQAVAQEPPLDLTVKSDPEGWARTLGGEVLPTLSVRLAQAGPVRALPGYEDGAWWVQDAGAALPARLLGPVRGLRVADLCAAPGGKTAQLALAGARVTAVDRSADRLHRLAENLARLKLEAQIVQADATRFKAEPFDAILLDAPCSATGTVRRHPDIAWHKSASDIAALIPVQARLLDHAADLLKPGGQMVYSTCSLEPEEGEHQIAALLARRSDLERVPLQPDDVPGGEIFITHQGDLRTLPNQWGHENPLMSGIDGFFASRLRKRG